MHSVLGKITKLEIYFMKWEYIKYSTKLWYKHTYKSYIRKRNMTTQNNENWNLSQLRSFCVLDLHKIEFTSINWSNKNSQVDSSQQYISKNRFQNLLPQAVVIVISQKFH